MEFTDQHRKMLQRLMTTKEWEGFEAFFSHFIATQFAQGSVRRDTEFNTIWFAAEMEGARRYFQQFKNEMEEEAKRVETR